MTREDAVKHFADFVVDDFYAASPGDRTKDNLRECIKDALQKIAEWEAEQVLNHLIDSEEKDAGLPSGTLRKEEPRAEAQKG